MGGRIILPNPRHNKEKIPFHIQLYIPSKIQKEYNRTTKHLGLTRVPLCDRLVGSQRSLYKP
jgi:hypothetical protein